ncbi:unknown protein [Seminavis robusta]|uniref:DDE Tnp4 domain-containing protein n=1 Tax=Seminavis robusta TaxID=568900 RepID=A0A9N8F2G6_9STRA|nr:unknown protein [Seminavis robusta]|eukprot:Sro3025_g342290.1 n/a (318) ;mRNA; r:4518-5540
MVVEYDLDAVDRLQEEFEVIAFGLFRNGRLSGSEAVKDRRVRAWCGVSLTVLSITWYLLQSFGGLKEGATMERFLWALNMLQQYPTEENGASRCGGVDEGTWSTWVWYFIDEVSYLENDVILWVNRFIGDVGNDCLLSADGVDFLTRGRKLDSGQPDKDYFSQKFNKPAYRYEIATNIRSSYICWIAGPYLPGVYNDLQIFRMGLRDKLDVGEKVEADDGYIAEREKCKCPHSMRTREDQRRMRGRLRMRQEKLNRLLKNFHTLDVPFRHGASKHGSCVHAICVLVQLTMEQGEELFDMREYHDNMSDNQVAQLYGI